MGRKKSDRPTDTELKILRVLWEQGESTVREVHSRLKESRKVAYSTVLTQLQFMHQKGLVTRDDSNRSHVYKPARSKSDTERRFVRSLIEKSFGGSARSLVMHALSLQKAPPEEMERINKLLDELEDDEP